MAIDNRPLSPHLDIYRWRITMLTSILHRASGVAVSFGLLVLVLKLVFLATAGAEGFSSSGWFESTFWFGWSLAVYYHLCNGIRHLVWDTGRAFDIPNAEKGAKMVLAGSVVLTIFTWLFI